MTRQFKEIIKGLRNKRGMTQEGLAQEMNVSKSTVAMWETGDRFPGKELYEQLADFFNVDIDYFICLIALKCGLRVGEVIGLTDLSFNFKTGTITIDKQWKKLDNKKHGFGKPKSVNSYRNVPIPASYISALKKYVQGCVIGTDRRIFLDATTGTTVNRIRNKMIKLGLDASIHDLRHTYATTLLANGFDYKTVAELMGDNVQTIIRTYSHFTKDMFDSAKTRIDNIL